MQSGQLGDGASFGGGNHETVRQVDSKSLIVEVDPVAINSGGL
jgi:hypothetical protein